MTSKGASLQQSSWVRLTPHWGAMPLSCQLWGWGRNLWNLWGCSWVEPTGRHMRARIPESPPTALWAAWSSALVEKFKLDISKEESQQLIVKYDLKNNGKFAYCDFIQSCVLLLKAKETSLMQRMRIQNADKMVGVLSWRLWGHEPGTPRLSAQVDLDTQGPQGLPVKA